MGLWPWVGGAAWALLAQAAMEHVAVERLDALNELGAYLEHRWIELRVGDQPVRLKVKQGEAASVAEDACDALVPRSEACAATLAAHIEREMAASPPFATLLEDSSGLDEDAPESPGVGGPRAEIVSPERFSRVTLGSEALQFGWDVVDAETWDVGVDGVVCLAVTLDRSEWLYRECLGALPTSGQEEGALMCLPTLSDSRIEPSRSIHMADVEDSRRDDLNLSTTR